MTAHSVLAFFFTGLSLFFLALFVFVVAQAIFLDKKLEGLFFMVPIIISFLMMIPAFYFSQKASKETERFIVISSCGTFLGTMDGIYTQRGHQAKNAYARFNVEGKTLVFSKFSPEARGNIIALKKGNVVCIEYYLDSKKTWDGSFSLIYSPVLKSVKIKNL